MCVNLILENNRIERIGLQIKLKNPSSHNLDNSTQRIQSNQLNYLKYPQHLGVIELIISARANQFMKYLSDFIRLQIQLQKIQRAAQKYLNMFNNQQKLPSKKVLKCFAISDTHEQLGVLEQIAEKQTGDVFIHGGDFTYYGQTDYFIKFAQIMAKMKFKHKIIISGNHEISLDDTYISNKKKKLYFDQFPCNLTKKEIIAKLQQSGCTYLEHGEIDIEGVKFFGSPFTLYYCGSAFQYHHSYDQDIWRQIPQKVDVLITHCPPYSILDKNVKGILCGSKALLKHSLERKPKFHLFGHIHEARGIKKNQNTCYANIAMNAIRFEIQIPNKDK